MEKENDKMASGKTMIKMVNPEVNLDASLQVGKLLSILGVP